jgi:MFS family permease
VLAMAVGAPVSGRMLDRMGSRVVVIFGCTMIGIGLLLVGVLPPTITSFYTAGVVIGIGLSSLLGSSLRYIMLNEAPPAQRGAAQGVLTLFTSIGQLLGAAAVGAIVASYGGAATGYNAAFRALGIFMLLLAGASFGLKMRGAELSDLR